MRRALALALAACGLLVACNREPTAPAAAALTVDDELARYCRVCAVDTGVKHEEYLPTRLNVEREGRTYRFCKDDCRKAFDKEPGKYTVAE
jgi:YHS domain-containing protein